MGIEELRRVAMKTATQRRTFVEELEQVADARRGGMDAQLGQRRGHFHTADVAQFLRVDGVEELAQFPFDLLGVFFEDFPRDLVLVVLVQLIEQLVGIVDVQMQVRQGTDDFFPGQVAVFVRVVGLEDLTQFRVIVHVDLRQFGLKLDLVP